MRSSGGRSYDAAHGFMHSLDAKKCPIELPKRLLLLIGGQYTGTFLTELRTRNDGKPN
jgi:hypothetical protein